MKLSRVILAERAWLRAQNVLAVRAHRSERERKHPHYLRGSIYCGTCSERLVYTQHTGRRGGQYCYYSCVKRRQGSRFCPSCIIRIEKIEDGIADLYRRIQLSDDEVARLRLAVRGELADRTADAHEHAEQANRQMARLAAKRAKLMQAHYDDAIPADLFTTEMLRITRAMAAAERETKFARGPMLRSSWSKRWQSLGAAGGTMTRRRCSYGGS